MLSADLDRFYELLDRLKGQPGQGRPLSEYTGGSMWPRRGVYFFLELGEYRREQSDTPRVVRVGTHAGSAGPRRRYGVDFERIGVAATAGAITEARFFVYTLVPFYFAGI